MLNANLYLDADKASSYQILQHELLLVGLVDRATEIRGQILPLIFSWRDNHPLGPGFCISDFGVLLKAWINSHGSLGKLGKLYTIAKLPRRHLPASVMSI